MKRKAGIAVSLALVVGAAVALSDAPVSASTTHAHIGSSVSAAQSYGRSHGLSAGVAMYDSVTGTLYSSNGKVYFGSASVVKVFVAAKLLLTGQMTGKNETTAYSMITRSSNSAYNTLAPKVGGLSVITWVKHHYNISELGSPPPFAKRHCWGNTQISAVGMVKFYAAVKKDPKVGPWLINAMHHYTVLSAGGDKQTFGLPTASRQAGVKQGWGNCSSNTDGTEMNTTGFSSKNRYTVAILTSTNQFSANHFVGPQGNIVTHMARMLLPVV